METLNHRNGLRCQLGKGGIRNFLGSFILFIVFVGRKVGYLKVSSLFLSKGNNEILLEPVSSALR